MCIYSSQAVSTLYFRYIDLQFVGGMHLTCMACSDLDCGYQDDASSSIAGKSAITTMMKSTNKQRHCKTKHDVVDKMIACIRIGLYASCQ